MEVKFNFAMTGGELFDYAGNTPFFGGWERGQYVAGVRFLMLF